MFFQQRLTNINIANRTMASAAVAYWYLVDDMNTTFENAPGVKWDAGALLVGGRCPRKCGMGERGVKREMKEMVQTNRSHFHRLVRAQICQKRLAFNSRWNLYTQPPTNKNNQ
jgi:hypothetical protein